MTHLFTIHCRGPFETRPSASGGWPRFALERETPYVLDSRRQRLVLEGLRQACATNHWTLVAAKVHPDVMRFIVTSRHSAERILSAAVWFLDRVLEGAGIDTPGRRRWGDNGAAHLLRTGEEIEAAVQELIVTVGGTTATFVGWSGPPRPALRQASAG